MIGLDTNVLARYFVQDESDIEAKKQHTAAKILIESGKPLMVCKTVILEFEWVLRGYYHFSTHEISSVLKKLLSLEHISIEDRGIVQNALENYELGFDFADVLHHSSYKSCDKMASFDDKKFFRRAVRYGFSPPVFIPK